MNNLERSIYIIYWELYYYFSKRYYSVYWKIANY